MPKNDITAIWQAVDDYFDRVEVSVLSAGQLRLSEDESREAQVLEAGIVQAAGALLSPGQNPLVGEADQRDLRFSVRRMSAALRLRGYQQWDAQVIFDEDVYRGTEPAGQSEYDLDSVVRARVEFSEAAKQFSRIVAWAYTTDY